VESGGAADEAVLNKVHKKNQKIPKKSPVIDILGKMVFTVIYSTTF
jgi:hypothetical protein